MPLLQMFVHRSVCRTNPHKRCTHENLAVWHFLSWHHDTTQHILHIWWLNLVILNNRTKTVISCKKDTNSMKKWWNIAQWNSPLESVYLNLLCHCTVLWVARQPPWLLHGNHIWKNKPKLIGRLTCTPMGRNYHVSPMMQLKSHKCHIFLR